MRSLQSILVSCAIGIVPPAFGGVIGGPEIEPNSSIESADFLGAVEANNGTFVFGSLTPGDVDYFGVELPAFTTICAHVSGVGLNFANVLLGMFDSSGALLTTSQKYSPPNGPQILAGDVPNAGTYYLAVTGITDVSFVGEHDFGFNYTFSIEALAIPAPAPLTILALAATTRRRRDIR
jgi:hypothetical protein